MCTIGVFIFAIMGVWDLIRLHMQYKSIPISSTNLHAGHM
jgi:hypothetical protein